MPRQHIARTACLSFVLSCSVTTALTAADRKPLTHDVYDLWKKVSGETISNNGAWVLHVIEPQEGDGILLVRNLRSGACDTIPRGVSPRVSFDSRFAAFVIKPPFADVKKAKAAKKKSDEMPKDTLALLQLGTDSLVRIPRAKSFKFPEKGAGWIAVQMERDSVKRDSAGARAATDNPGDAETNGKEKTEEQGTTLLLRRLEDGREFRYPSVTGFAFSKPGNALAFASTGDSSSTPGVFLFNTGTLAIDTLSRGKGTYKHLAFDDDGKQLAFLADRDTGKAKQRYFSLCYWTPGRDSATVLADTATSGLPVKWLISENRIPDFSKNGMRLYVGTAPVPMPEDTTLTDEETAKLDVWNWQDDYVQPHQLKIVEQEKKRSYLAVLDLPRGTFTQLGTQAIPSVTVAGEGDNDVALGLSDIPYRKLVSWEDMPFHDVYVIDVRTGRQTKVLDRVKGTPSLSPNGRFVLWYDMSRRHWRTLAASSLAQAVITRTINVPLYNELSDVPDDPGAHGVASWTENDSTVLVYDRYDIWSADPAGNTPAVCLTGGHGRTSKSSYRYLRMDPEEKFLRPEASMLLKVFNTVTKDAGYARMRLGSAQHPVPLVTGGFEFTTPVKAKHDSTFLFQKSSFTVSPDLYAADAEFRTITRLSDCNPQQKDYLWGSVELVHWIGADGKVLDGLLIKPPQFDPKKKYPMIVYYYERMSDLLHRYFAPQPSASSINPTMFASNGYLVFLPDIRYRIGYPGQSAVDCVVPGVKKLIAAGFVNPARIGLQGQSWGGYQTAFIITRTGMFRAAMAGAPVSNMTSAYGGIRWESGVSRMFQYERDQSRIGGTLWQKRDLYLENSPLFAADRVTTPLLIMHNDEDGAVPWYQGIELFTALRRLGKPVWMLTYNKEAHNLVQRKNRKDISVRQMQFFDHYLIDAPAPVWMTRGIPAVNKGKTLGLELDLK
ncbi:MAG TPA: prolyl oligopeptidase family serine peptidase [Bacteroidota bacterium]|nr:prolyl oligopeptidase family serine peptidase [Bacteroidota bacterium]